MKKIGCGSNESCFTIYLACTKRQPENLAHRFSGCLCFVLIVLI
ncbi:hypothetical protein GCWU000324_00064 [Kingella oralis ATCC 51147]|uniref:Uncharacterized protein n=1 Tax=Kingella oralis ATCC 51147 TaxID=629741 RepID=C4GEH7_9NEIS|nr:hypothetical protein GCWU000324_00064 [Kingella oralis ATCC 51147]